MTRYIDADKFHEWVYPNWSYCAQNDDDFHEAIDAQPTADVAPVIHAHWKDEFDGYICSNCKKKFSDEMDFLRTPDEFPWTPKYCPDCGAVMDEVAE